VTEIYLDENLSEHVAGALNLLNKGYFPYLLVHSTKVKFGKGAADEEIIPVIGKTGGTLITKDINFHRTAMQYQLCRQYKLGVFFLKLPKGQDRHWEIVKLLINNWEEMAKLTNEKNMPFGFEILTRGKMKKIL
jgi:hypothetical protein